MFRQGIPHELTLRGAWHKARSCCGMKRHLVVLTVVAAVAGGVVGCATRADHDYNKRTAGQVIDDTVLAQRVRGVLGDSPVYKFPDVKMETFAGTVQLSGFVDTNEQKRRAEELARNVRGVVSVQNQITLKPEAQRVRGVEGTDANNNINNPGTGTRNDGRTTPNTNNNPNR
jgi:hyperosmotically inducible periplasmic protein